MLDLYLGDCLQIMPKLKEKSIDLILCDLPYGTTKCKWDEIIPFDRLWKEYDRVIKDNGAIILFGTEPFSSQIRMSNLKLYKYDLYWHKTLCSNFVMGKKQPFFKIETLSVFYKKAPTYNPQKVSGSPYTVKESHVKQKGLQQNYTFTHKKDYENVSERYPDNLLEFGSLGGKTKLHPTQKPVDLLEYLIKTYTNENDMVLDNCMGSGSTGVACKNLNRNFIGIEKDENYFRIAEKRLNYLEEKLLRNY